MRMAQKTTRKKPIKSTKAALNVWFKPVRGSYIPVRWEGWLLYFPFTAYLIAATIYAFSDTGSGLEGVMFVVPNWVAATAVMTWIAKRMS